MEAALRNSGHVVKEEMRVQSNGGDEESGCKEEIVFKIGDGRKYHNNDNLKRSSSPHMDLSRSNKQDDEIESAKAEIGEVREENQRLRVHLDRIMKDYQTLQMQFRNIAHQEVKKSPNAASTTLQETKEETEFVSLSLGRTSSIPKSDEKFKISSNDIDYEQDKEGLGLGLDCKFELPKKGITELSSSNPSTENSLEDRTTKEDAGESNWLKSLKTIRSGDDEISQQNPVKKARVSVRVRCDTPTMNDGCQWRKYGQKIAKGNPCPRAYYRCTVAPSCPVRKQVQRCADDMSILITTYEGTHNHPLPISATAMASTTSAAASMLMSGSSTSTHGPTPPPSMSTNLHGLNFYLSNNTKPNQFYIPNSTISPSPSHPTITLDLTSSTSSSSSSLSSHNFMKTHSSFPPVPQYSSTNLSFSSLESNPLPTSWNNVNVLNYGSTSQPYNNNHPNGSQNLGRVSQETFYQPYMQKSTNPNLVPQDHISAATKAITSDPSFQSALAAALTSLIGGGGSGGDKFGQNLKLAESFQDVTNLSSSTSNANKCSSSYLINKTPTTTSSQPESLMFMQPSFPFSLSKSKSTSPGDHTRDHVM